jgi:hypothetical protein
MILTSKTKRDWANAFKKLLRLKMGFYGMDGTFNVIKSSYYSPRRSLLLPRL